MSAQYGSQFNGNGQSQQQLPDLRVYLTRTNVLRLAAVACLGYFIYSAFGVAPKMASKAGAPVNDVINTLIPLVGSAVAWLVANWSTTVPDLVQAVSAVAKSPRDLGAWTRLAFAAAVTFKAAFPDSKAAGTLIQFSRELHDELLGPQADQNSQQSR